MSYISLGLSTIYERLDFRDLKSWTAKFINTYKYCKFVLEYSQAPYASLIYEIFNSIQIYTTNNIIIYKFDFIRFFTFHTSFAIDFRMIIINMH